MDPSEVQTALEAANVALSGRRRREASSFASVELRTPDPERGTSHWEVLLSTALGLLTVVALLVLWFY